MPFVIFSLTLAGLFIVFILVNVSRETKQKRAQLLLFITFLLLMVYHLLMVYLYYANKIKSNFLLAHYYRVDILIGMSICPCIALFQHSWMNKKEQLKKGVLALHALPFLPALIYVVWFACKPPEIRINMLVAHFVRLSSAESWLLVIFYAQLFHYLSVGLLKNWGYRKSKFVVIIDNEPYTIRWLFYLYLVAFLILMVTIPISLYKKCDAYYTLLGIIVVDTLFIYLFVNAFKNTQLMMLKAETSNKPVDPSLHLPQELMLDYQQTLLDKMKEQPIYLSPKCTITDVANLTHIPVHHLSYLLNHQLKTNFSDFINEYRVNFACEQLRLNKAKRYTFEALFGEFGFGSKTNFYRIFKKVTGKTPKQYIEGLPVEKMG